MKFVVLSLSSKRKMLMHKSSFVLVRFQIWHLKKVKNNQRRSRVVQEIKSQFLSPLLTVSMSARSEKQYLENFHFDFTHSLTPSTLAVSTQRRWLIFHSDRPEIIRLICSRCRTIIVFYRHLKHRPRCSLVHLLWRRTIIRFGRFKRVNLGSLSRPIMTSPISARSIWVTTPVETPPQRPRQRWPVRQRIFRRSIRKSWWNGVKISGSAVSLLVQPFVRLFSRQRRHWINNRFSGPVTTRRR